MASASASQALQRCIFCKIATGQDANASIVFQNERICILKDIRPGADHHLLAVPKNHMDDVRTLTAADKPLLEEMRTELGNVLKDQFQVDSAAALFGFHMPPFTMVKHLHMHGMGPVGSMGFLSRMIYKPNTWWFNTDQAVFEKYLPRQHVVQVNHDRLIITTCYTRRFRVFCGSIEA